MTPYALAALSALAGLVLLTVGLMLIRKPDERRSDTPLFDAVAGELGDPLPEEPSPARYVRVFDDGRSVIDHLDGVDWFHAPNPKPRHKCWAQTRAFVAMHAEWVFRCACGSIAFDEPEDFMQKNANLDPHHTIFSDDYYPTESAFPTYEPDVSVDYWPAGTETDIDQALRLIEPDAATVERIREHVMHETRLFNANRRAGL